mgnify:CR=1 FL=1
MSPASVASTALTEADTSGRAPPSSHSVLRRQAGSAPSVAVLRAGIARGIKRHGLAAIAESQLRRQSRRSRAGRRADRTRCWRQALERHPVVAAVDARLEHRDRGASRHRRSTRTVSPSMLPGVAGAASKALCRQVAAASVVAPCPGCCRDSMQLRHPGSGCAEHHRACRWPANTCARSELAADRVADRLAHRAGRGRDRRRRSSTACGHAPTGRARRAVAPGTRAGRSGSAPPTLPAVKCASAPLGSPHERPLPRAIWDRILRYRTWLQEVGSDRGPRVLPAPEAVPAIAAEAGLAEPSIAARTEQLLCVLAMSRSRTRGRNARLGKASDNSRRSRPPSEPPLRCLPSAFGAVEAKAGALVEAFVANP